MPLNLLQKRTFTLSVFKLNRIVQNICDECDDIKCFAESTALNAKLSADNLMQNANKENLPLDVAIVRIIRECEATLDMLFRMKTNYCDTYGATNAFGHYSHHNNHNDDIQCLLSDDDDDTDRSNINLNHTDVLIPIQVNHVNDTEVKPTIGVVNDFVQKNERMELPKNDANELLMPKKLHFDDSIEMSHHLHEPKAQMHNESVKLKPKEMQIPNISQIANKLLYENEWEFPKSPSKTESKSSAETNKSFDDLIFDSGNEGNENDTTDLISTFICNSITLKRPKPRIGRMTNVSISFIKSPLEFYLHLNTNDVYGYFHKIQVEQEEMIKSEPSKVDHFELGTFCAALYSQDECWYRAQIIGIERENNSKNIQITVKYIDWGNIETLPLKKIMKLSPNLHAPIQALQCSLQGIDTRDLKLTEKVIDEFKGLVEGHSLHVYFLENTPNVDGDGYIHYVDLFRKITNQRGKTESENILILMNSIELNIEDEEKERTKIKTAAHSIGFRLPLKVNHK